MADLQTEDIWCSTLSREVSEPLFGSAPRNDVWLLLEYSQPWGAKVLPESDLSPSIKTRLNTHLSSIAKSNLLFIKQQFKRVEGLALYVALPRETDPRLYEFRLRDYDDLLKLDIPTIAGGDAQYDAQLTQEPLYLVCTNARRDRCCARLGLPVYRELAAQVGSRLWQCSHIGGHRFAPTTLFFPHGVTYGRIEPGEATTLAADYRQGRLNLERLRGRVCYDSPTQAADFFLREHLELDAMDDLKHGGTETLDADNWRVQFQNGTAVHTLHIRKVLTDVLTQNSCPPAEQIPLARYALIAHSSN
jgi:hypothetical protein